MLTVSKLFIYPIKSCGPVPVQQLQFDECGPKGDRRFMLVDEAGQFLTQRTLPAMAYISPVITDNGLVVNAPEQPELTVLYPRTGEDSRVMVWKDEISATDCGDEAAAWFSQYLGIPARLVAVSPATQRQVSRKYAEEGELVGFADGYPLLVALQESLDYLSGVVGRTLDIERFRPNIVVQGAAAFAEREWRGLRAHQGYMPLVKPCERCVIPTRDLLTQQREADVLTALKEYCRLDGRIIFGQNALVRNVDVLNVGDCLTSE
jgi:uncharacterized protein YcbX